MVSSTIAVPAYTGAPTSPSAPLTYEGAASGFTVRVSSLLVVAVGARYARFFFRYVLMRLAFMNE